MRHLLLIFSVILGLFLGQAQSAPQSQTKLILALDGLSWESYQQAKSMGLFESFGNTSIHITTFPSISDYAWNEIFHAREVHGRAGRIKSAEASYFDDGSQKLITDPREYFRRLSNPKHYMGAFDVFLNPYLEGLMYFPSKEIFQVELDHIEKQVMLQKDKEIITALVGGIDSTAHTQLDSLYSLLVDVDQMIKNIQTSFFKAGIDLEVILISDHGNVGQFVEGEREKPLLSISLEETLQKANLRSVNQLKNENDVAIPVMALANYVSLNFKNRNFISRLIQAAKSEPWFDLAMYIVDQTISLLVIEVESKEGIARIHYNKLLNTYLYEPVTANPFKITNLNSMTSSEALAHTADGPYPDALFRISQAASHQEIDFPDLMLSLKDGYFIEGNLSEFTQMIRTHGSLSKKSSYGLLASTQTLLPTYIRSKDILFELGVSPPSLFNVEMGYSDIHKTVVGAGYEGIKTNAERVLDNGGLSLIDRFVDLSRFYFDLTTMESIFLAFKKITQNQPEIEVNLNSKVLLTPQEIGQISDIVFGLKDPQKIIENPQFQELKTTLMQRLKIKTSTEGDLKETTLPLKRLLMKSYAFPFLLEKILDIPEMPAIKDNRDVNFFYTWMTSLRSVLSSASFDVDANQTTYSRLFNEIFLERRYVEQIAPYHLSSLYNRYDEISSDVTIVYVPGIYNDIFDNEIFQMGLDSLKNKLGIRVIEAPVKSRCSADYNGKIIMQFLKNDMQRRKRRGHKQPQYLILGYSKGGIDALYSFLEDETFTAWHVLGLLTIASPLQGADVLNTTDLPVKITDLLSEGPLEKACEGEGGVSYSILPVTMRKFWKDHEQKLLGLTRYYSISFQSDPSESHLWLRAAKLIHRFLEPNDGVVSVRASKFPKNFHAIDLGVVEGADHLAGILASNFPQRPFMESLVLSLAELNAFDKLLNSRWNLEVYIEESLNLDNKHRSNLIRLIHKTLGRDLGISSLVQRRVDVAKAYNEAALPRLSDKSWQAISDEIQRLLNNSPYEVKEFSLKLKAGGLYSVQRSAGFLGTGFFASENKIPIKDISSLLDLLLSDLSKSGYNYIKLDSISTENYPVSNRVKFQVPGVSDISPSIQKMFNVNDKINVQKILPIMAQGQVTPIQANDYPAGINFIFDHHRFRDFREEYQWHYETTCHVGCEENSDSGYSAVLGEDHELYAKLVSQNTSLRLTTLSYRFKPADYPQMGLKLMVKNDVEGADPVLGGNGRDDSAFQVWFVIREVLSDTDRSQTNNEMQDTDFFFGYYWGDRSNNTSKPKVSDIYENTYSEYMWMLPVGKQLLLNYGEENLNKLFVFNRNLKEDLKRAFPDKNVENLEIIAITLQHDSNDTRGDSEAWFKFLTFKQ